MATIASYVIEGTEFAMETVNFMMFICQEASQVAIMAYKEAMRQKKYKSANKALNQYAAPTNLMVRNWAFTYGMIMTPAWQAFYCYYYCTKIYILELGFKFHDEILGEIVKEGKDPNAMIDGKRYYQTWLEEQG
jgi:hypothetical protein